MILRVHALLPRTEANGPGIRAGIWVQGCRQHCFNCCNPETHDPKGGQGMQVTRLARWLSELPDIEGVTISGGEPMDQADALRELLLRRPKRLSIVLYTGYTLGALREREAKLDTRLRVLSHVDVLVHGPYRHDMHTGSAMIGSHNQQVELLTPRYTMEQIQQVPDFEIVVFQDGSRAHTGVGAVPRRLH